MPLIKQSAFISQSPLDVQIGGTWTIPPPPYFIIPAYNIQEDRVVISNGKGKWVTSADYHLTFSVGATTFLFSDIQGSASGFMVQAPSTITSLSAPNLVFVGGNLLSAGPVTLSSLTSVSLPSLYYVGTIFSNTTMPSLTSLDLSSLVYVLTGISLTANSLTSFNLSKLKYAGSISFNSTSATSISLASIVSATSISITASLCTTLTFPSLGTLKILNGSCFISGALDQTTVDNILAALAYMDGTNSTLSYGTGKTVSLVGTSSAPSNAGSTTTAGSNFVGTTTTCTVSLTSHGYLTGDVLRVSGITTLTNANRYAVITVVNANQFTYTITSQTAVGAGTATIVKANASAKALVTRGVTLTTN